MSKTAVVECRCDVRALASCARLFQQKGIMPRSKSELLGMIVESFAKAVEREGIVPLSSTEEAVGFFNEIGLGSMNRVKREGRRANISTLSKVISEERGVEEVMKVFNSISSFENRTKEDNT